MHLRPGELRIEFNGAEELLQRLFELSQAILNDYKKFGKICERGGCDSPAVKKPDLAVFYHFYLILRADPFSATQAYHFHTRKCHDRN